MKPSFASGSLAATIVTAGRAARLGVYELLDFAYQDSGLLGSLMNGTLDAPEHMAAGSHAAGLASVIERGEVAA